MYPFLKSPWYISLNHTLNNFVSIIHIHAGIVIGISVFWINNLWFKIYGFVCPALYLQWQFDSFDTHKIQNYENTGCFQLICKSKSMIVSFNS